MIDLSAIREEYIKCVSDTSRVYMITHFLKTFDATQRKEVPFQLFPRQQDLCRILGNANNVVTTKPRQAGITTTAGAFLACEMILSDDDSPKTVLIIGNTIDLAQQMLVKIRDFLYQFPAWMWGPTFVDADSLKTEEDFTRQLTRNQIFKTCNTKELVLKNGCRVVARSSGPDASRGVGGVYYLVFDESAFIENGNDVYASALPTVSTGGHIIMISTPNGKDQLYYETCRRAALKGTSDWNNFELVKLKWYQDPRYNKFLEWTRKSENSTDVEVMKEEYLDNKGNVKYTPERWAQLEEEGWHPRSPWYIKMCQQFNNDPKKIAQELDVSFMGSASNVVDPKYIEMQEVENVKEPQYSDPMEDDTWIWQEPIPGHHYLLAVDNSRGDSADRTAIEIIDIDGVDENGVPELTQVLEYHGKKTGDDVGEMVYRYGMMYNQAFVVVECIGGVGDATVLMLKRLNYPNLYYDDPTLTKYTAEREVSSLSPDIDGRLPGFHTSSLRYQVLTNFANMVRTNQFKIRSKRVIAELETWIYKGPQAKIDHMDGCHDDTLTCLAMGLFVLQFSMKAQESAKALDKAMAGAWVGSSTFTKYEPKKNTQTVTITPKYSMPFVTGNERKPVNNINNYGWLLR